MTGAEYDFLADQRGPRKQFCEDTVDKQWKKAAERRAREQESYKRREEKAKEEAKKMEKVELTDELVEGIFQDICDRDEKDDADYTPAREEDEEEEEEEGEEGEEEEERENIKKSNLKISSEKT